MSTEDKVKNTCDSNEINENIVIEQQQVNDYPNVISKEDIFKKIELYARLEAEDLMDEEQ